MKPHLSRYWLNTKETDAAVFQQQAENVCGVYAQAQSNYEKGIHTVSSDEMTGIQAASAPVSDPASAYWAGGKARVRV